MEASVSDLGRERKLESEKAQRIVAAMRESVGTLGAAGVTFDRVAHHAGVSRGLLHYYFGSKERLLVEVVRHDTELRVQALERNLAAADSLDGVVEVLVSQVRAFLAEDPASQAVIYEMFSASRHNEELRLEMAKLFQQTRAHIAAALREKQEAGVVTLGGDPEHVASVLLGLGDGFTMQLISDPDWDSDAAFQLGIRTARFLLGADA
ncbi:MAG: TetR/AcrR family transcriptional regulator [Thermoleophilaceae bacterium]